MAVATLPRRAVGRVYVKTKNKVSGCHWLALKINKATTTLITFLFFKLIFGAFETSVKTCEWIAMVLTWIVSIIALVPVWKSTTECVGEEPAPPRHRASVASRAWRSTIQAS